MHFLAPFVTSLLRPLTHGSGVDDAIVSVIVLVVMGAVFGIGWWRDRQREGEDEGAASESGD